MYSKLKSVGGAAAGKASPPPRLKRPPAGSSSPVGAMIAAAPAGPGRQPRSNYTFKDTRMLQIDKDNLILLSKMSSIAVHGGRLDNR